MSEASGGRPPVPDGARLATDRTTVLCVAVGGAVAAVIAYVVSSDVGEWRRLPFDVRLPGLLIGGLLMGFLFGFRDRIGSRWFGFLVFGLLSGFTSVGVYALIGLLGMPPHAGVTFVVAAPLLLTLGGLAGGWIARAVRR